MTDSVGGGGRGRRFRVLANTWPECVGICSDFFDRRTSRDFPGPILEGYLVGYAVRQLEVVLTPRILQLRRLVIGEVGRFPELGAALYAGGPGRAIASPGA